MQPIKWKRLLHCQFGGWKVDEATGTRHNYDHDPDVRRQSFDKDANAQSSPHSQYERG